MEQYYFIGVIAGVVATALTTLLLLTIGRKSTILYFIVSVPLNFLIIMVPVYLWMWN